MLLVNFPTVTSKSLHNVNPALLSPLLSLYLLSHPTFQPNLTAGCSPCLPYDFPFCLPCHPCSHLHPTNFPSFISICQNWAHISRPCSNVLLFSIIKLPSPISRKLGTSDAMPSIAYAMPGCSPQASPLQLPFKLTSAFLPNPMQGSRHLMKPDLPPPVLFFPNSPVTP